MTVQEMHYALDQGLQKVASSVYDYFLPEESDFWLNRAQERFIKQRLHPEGDPKKLGFSKNEKRLNDLRSIIEVDFEDQPAVLDPTADFIEFDIPTEFMFLINARVSMYITCGGTIDTGPGATPVERDLRIVSQDDVYHLQQNPFGKSSPSFPMAIMYDEAIRVFQSSEKFILETLYLDYLREPVSISLNTNVNCELADHTHHEIVDLAVKSIIEAIESPRYQSNSIEQSQSE
tara:strand:- start:15732 stop:16430 length:699 start_codon:yes stop_codon:yes gene_type:complete